MANQCFIEPTKFEDIRDGAVSYGVRIFDNYSKLYINTWDRIPDSDLDVLRLIINDHFAETSEFWDFAFTCQKGVFVGDTYYEWNVLEPLLEGCYEKI
jgi:hypothetical protein